MTVGGRGRREDVKVAGGTELPEALKTICLIYIAHNASLRPHGNFLEIAELLK